MSKPLAIIHYVSLMPGGQLANKLQDLGYRVHSLPDLAALAETCQTEKPLVVLAEIVPGAPAFSIISRLRRDPATRHIPVLGYSAALDATLQNHARDAGVTLLAGTAAISEHLPKLLDQVLQVE
jgi:PleD family two-component response regulator